MYVHDITWWKKFTVLQAISFVCFSPFFVQGCCYFISGGWNSVDVALRLDEVQQMPPVRYGLLSALPWSIRNSLV